jgi:hypothetical protein
MRSVALFAAAALLAGCAAVTVSDVEKDGDRFSFSVDAPPSTVYRRVVERSRECLSVGQMRVDADYFPEEQSGRVTLLAADAGPLTISTTRISRAPGGGALVEVSYYNPAKRKALPAMVAPIQPWARGEPGTCDADSMKPRPRPDASRT